MAVLFGGATALLPIFSQTILHVGRVRQRAAASSSGNRCGGGRRSVSRARPLRRRVGRTLLIVVALFGLFTVVFGLSTNFALSMAALAALAGAE